MLLLDNEAPQLAPDLVLETSWEVCNKVGGIYTVLSTRAATMKADLGDEGLLFIGPHFPNRLPNDFMEVASFDGLAQSLSEAVGLEVKVGRWRVPSEPRVALVDFQPLFKDKDFYYHQLWERYGIDGTVGYGDYDESVLFAIAVAKVMVAYIEVSNPLRPLCTFNEWTTGAGLLYLKSSHPEVATTFITHATTVGRSIAGNGKSLYDYMAGYNGDQMAGELGVVGKHQVEKATAQQADAFGTVSEVTDVECRQLLERSVDVVVYNGFEPNFVPRKELWELQRKKGRERLIKIASRLYGHAFSVDTLIVMTSGRNEYRNKGLDLYIDVCHRLALNSHSQDATQAVIALIAVPGWVRGARADLQRALRETEQDFSMPMQTPYLTHDLNEPHTNQSFMHLQYLQGAWGEHVFPILIPAYLDGADGIVDVQYYDLLPAIDLTIFASYYEPWGYTPLESVAFEVPTITTDKAGFGQWAMQFVSVLPTLSDGVLVVPRNDQNFEEIAEQMAEVVASYGVLQSEKRVEAQEAARKIASKANWKHFYPQYQELYHRALSKK